MDLDIHATVFHPVRPNEPYFIVASAFSANGSVGTRSGARKCGAASTIEEARRKCCELARSLKGIMHECGFQVRALNCSHCPSPEAPACGDLAGRKDARTT